MPNAQVRQELSEFVMRSLAARRRDVLITYLDGHGKSGEYVAGVFAQENKIAAANICSQENVSVRLQAGNTKGEQISAVIVVDDIAATGQTLAQSMTDFAKSTLGVFQKSKAKLICCALYATPSASETILKQLRLIEAVHIDFRAGELIGARASAFGDESKLWASSDERDRAKALVVELGSRIVSVAGAARASVIDGSWSL
jgi:hypothetical protein